MLKLNLYEEINEKQNELLKEADIIIENKNYNKEEIDYIYNSLSNHIFSKSKNDVGKEINKYMNLMQFIDNKRK